MPSIYHGSQAHETHLGAVGSDIPAASSNRFREQTAHTLQFAGSAQSHPREDLSTGTMMYRRIHNKSSEQSSRKLYQV